MTDGELTVKVYRDVPIAEPRLTVSEGNPETRKWLREKSHTNDLGPNPSGHQLIGASTLDVLAIREIPVSPAERERIMTCETRDVGYWLMRAATVESAADLFNDALFAADDDDDFDDDDYSDEDGDVTEPAGSPPSR